MKPTLLHAGNPGPYTGDGNWTYLVAGERPVLIDAGVGRPEHLEAIAAAATGGPVEVVVTHAHSDHASGAPMIQSRWPAARFLKHPWPERDSSVPWLAIADGEIVMSGAGPLEVLHTPGHSPDHLALWHADSRTVFVGDLLQLGTTVFIPASSGGSLADYLASLERVRQLSPARAWPAHGPVIEDPMALIQYYLDHRRQREQQVLSALADGLASVAAIADRIYTDLAPALAPMARESVLAHLVKLEGENKARRDGVSWAVVP